ncbi:MAG: [acyl-carrier-protein] S-malonyltransferase [Dehalococcoidia bacterium]|nr:MAG: [acyl-carrier-protein] S-malonyltransferase [Dehalococcoidia bacterium]
MGADLYEQLPAARAVFDTADAALGIKLSTLCFSGPEGELTQTRNTQPALVTHAIAALVAALDAGTLTHRPAFVAGHSLGEYAALVAAGSVTFEEGVRLVRLRGEAMQAACDAQPSTMAAILGMEPDALRAAITPHGASLCNINAPGNITIGGTTAAVEAASAAATAAGASRVVPLTVAGAFHTPLMAGAAEQMRANLAAVAFRNPTMPVVSNVTATPLTAGDSFAAELEQQITAPVLWLASAEAMKAAGVSKFIEFGPGKVLSGLLKRIERSFDVKNMGTVEEVRA